MVCFLTRLTKTCFFVFLENSLPFMSALSCILQGGSQYYHRQLNVGTTYTSVVSLMVDELQKGKSLSHQGDGKLIYDAIVLFRF